MMNNKKRVFQGACVVCGRRTYLNSDGSGDPRGSLGLSASDELRATEYDCVGDDVPLCWGCGQDRETYQRGLMIAYERWARQEELIAKAQGA